MGKIVFITGASSGIGRSCACRFAESGYNLVISGRREEKLQELATELAARFNVVVIPLQMDVSRQDEISRSLESLPGEYRIPDILINNAGLALGLEPFHKGNFEQWDQMIDTNVKGLVYLSRALAPAMVGRGSGHIINIGSIAGREVYPNGNIYCATKAAVDSITKAMRIDLLPYGIKVSQIAPGAAETEFSTVRFSGDETRAKAVYEGFEPLRPEDIAEAVYYVASQPPHVNINDLLIMPAAQATAAIINRKSLSAE